MKMTISVQMYRARIGMHQQCPKFIHQQYLVQKRYKYLKFYLTAAFLMSSSILMLMIVTKLNQISVQLFEGFPQPFNLSENHSGKDQKRLSLDFMVHGKCQLTNLRVLGSCDMLQQEIWDPGAMCKLSNKSSWLTAVVLNKLAHILYGNRNQ